MKIVVMVLCWVAVSGGYREDVQEYYKIKEYNIKHGYGELW